MHKIISYAQNAEDVLLKRVFNGKCDGYYVDIGASHPENLSVTKIFYDAGWTGVNVDPIKGSMLLFDELRPKDTNLNIAIGSQTKTQELFEVTNYLELSTFSKSQAEKLKSLGHEVNCYNVDVFTGNELFAKYVKKQVDFLKIDVEGHEFDVIRSLDLKKFRPRIMVVEATVPNADFPGWDKIDTILSHFEWDKHLKKNGYLYVHFDGLNRYYLRKEDANLKYFFNVGPCLWDSFIPFPIADRIETLEKAYEAKQLEQKTALHQISELEKQIFITHKNVMANAWRTPAYFLLHFLHFIKRWSEKFLNKK